MRITTHELKKFVTKINQSASTSAMFNVEDKEFTRGFKLACNMIASWAKAKEEVEGEMIAKHYGEE